MTDRVLLVDSDIFILLSAAGMLHRVSQLLGVKAGHVRRLAALPSQLKRSRKFIKNYPQAIRDAALARCDDCLPITQRPSDAVLEHLAEVDDIDEGEALMFGLAAENPYYYLASGDKRAMKALGSTPALKEIRGALGGRIICLEAVLQLLVQADGVASVAGSFTTVRDGNITLRVVFSEAGATDQDQCLHYLRAYFDDLQATVGPDLLYQPS